MTTSGVHARSTGLPEFGPDPVPAGFTIGELLAEPLPRAYTAGFAVKVADPSPGQRRQCYLALHAAGEALAQYPRAARTELVGVLDELPGGKRRSDRTRVLLHARTLLRHLPAGARVTPSSVAAAERALTAAEHAMQPSRRLAVVDAGGRTWLLETHPARRPGGTADEWMNRRVAAHHALGSHLPNYAGALITTPRCDAAAVHHPDRGLSHRLGACDTCRGLEAVTR